MKINGKNFSSLAVFPSMITVPDCMVVKSNKLGQGHGEAKLYIASKKDMYDFYGETKFIAKCFLLKSDLQIYMANIKTEYFSPSQNYYDKDIMNKLWQERMEKVNKLDDIIFFDVKDQYQIVGPRGYVNSNDLGYKIIRELALPLVSYIYIEKIGKIDSPLYYWRLFVDFQAIWERKTLPLVFIYGKQKNNLGQEEKFKIKREEEIKKTRTGQEKYREKLLMQCHYCPFMMISDERLLIASHIKPWAASNEKEKIDPYNGYILSPMYDKLFDKGFITFTDDRHILLSNCISSYTWKRINLKNDVFVENLPIDDKRKEYLKFHRQSVFKGRYEEN
ncbi:MAG: HNH endonuclease [Selenomonadaceae bacterium]|nr:HNH endonuclease [Selenomonadaceae bacterium]